MKEISIDNKIIRISGNISEELDNYINDYFSINLLFDLDDFINYVNKKKYVIGYVGGKETRKNNPYDYIIYI